VSRGIQILKLMDELGKLPEYALVTQLQGFSVSIYTFDKNFQDLAKLISFLAEDPRAEALFWLRNRDQLMLAMRDIIRLIHNFVAAALSLIDHTRRLYEKLYADTNEFSDYQSRVSSEFAHDPLSQFVKCLRQYCQHYKAPNLDVTTSWEQGNEKPTRTFNLLKVDLTSFDGWSATAKKYLDAVVEKVSVLELTTEYRDKVIDFYEWFQSRQKEIHADELQRFKEKENQLLSLMLEDKIDMSFAESRQEIPHRKDEIFVSIFSSREFDELERIPRDSPERPLRAIELLEQRFFTISEETKQRIIQLYGLPDIVPKQNDRSGAS
jgi:hypothetical protein